MTTTIRSIVLALSLMIGWISALIFGLRSTATSAGYQLFITAILGFGLYASTSGIVISEFRKNMWTVITAVTFGVLAKVAIISGIMYLCFKQPQYIVLAIAVAQIDPLSVAAIRAKTQMSESGKALLSAWAAFDDPITVILTSYAVAFLVGSSFLPAVEAFGYGIALNVTVAGIAYVTWRVVKNRFYRNKEGVFTENRIVWVCVIIVIAIFAGSFSLLLGLALIGLFFRPVREDRLASFIYMGLLAAAFTLGLIWQGSFSWGNVLAGVVLGVAAYVAQALVALMLTIPRAWRQDRTRLALAQQNGMTAIVLALFLEPIFSGSIAIIAPAIIVINLLYVITNTGYDQWKLYADRDLVKAQDMCS